MTSRHPTHGVINLAALDLRGRPDHRSELKSQLLMGEVVRVLGAVMDGQWWRVESRADCYSGWIRTWGVIPAAREGAREWLERSRARVLALYAEVRAGRGRGPLVSPMFWNGRLVPGRTVGRYRPVELPDGRRGWIESRAIVVGSRPGIALRKRVRGLLGVPYMWGGRTPMGLDCSALTQQLLFEQGRMLPRDADDQYRICRPLDRGATPRLGDLVFFGPRSGRLGHVGMMLGKALYVHSRGQVRVNSMERGNPLWDSELSAQIRAIRRPIHSPAGRPRR